MRFVDPPKPAGRPPTTRWIEVAEQLRNNPDTFGLVGAFSNGVSTQIRKGRYTAFIPAGVEDKEAYMEKHWEVTTRRSSTPARNDLYVRWIGDGCACRFCYEP